jgi:hypothetical protein
MLRLSAGESLPHIGAYGFRLTGLESASRDLVVAPDSWPRLMIQRVVGPSTLKQPYFVGEEWAEFRTLDQTGQVGGVRMDREPLTVRFTSPGGFSDAAVIHPALGLIAAVANRWSGRDVFHAGAFLNSDGAWAVLGGREAGKSSLLGHLATKGVGIVADDAVVVDDDAGLVLAGPRCVDLREGAAKWLGQGEDIGMVGARRRWRMHVPAVAGAVPLRGWIVPEWGDCIELETVPAVLRPQLLYAHRYLGQLPRRPERVLDLIALPFVIFRRPRRWESADDATAALLDRLNG